MGKMEKPKYVIIDRRETVFESLIKDFVTFSLLLLSIYTSQGSRWWTFFTGVLFIIFLCTGGSQSAGEKVNTFTSKKEIETWLMSQPDDSDGEGGVV